MPNQRLKLVTGVLGMSGVGLGAFGAHALKIQLAEAGHAETWATAVLYHLVHTVAILAVSLALDFKTTSAISRKLRIAASCWAAGIVMFSGSLYALALGGPYWLGPVTPLGGLAFLAGWGWVFASGLSKAPPPKN